ncbi:MAG: hypothetical protein GJ680_07335 [Alteromonadaceae bacterium]|nr:hypothetical protein [Alteromonadaceae bacterium]
MRIAVFILGFLFTSCSSAIQVEVSVKINNESDYAVRQSARLKAKKEGLQNLPLLVSGVETFKDGRYRESIKALGIASVNVDVLEERWSRDSGTYSLVADVSLNEQDTLALFESVKDNQALVSRLQQVMLQFDQATKLTSTKEIVAANVALFEIKRDMLLRPTIEDSLAAKAQYKQELVDMVYYAYLDPMRHGLSVNVKDVDERYVHFDVVANHDFMKRWGELEYFILDNEHLKKQRGTLPGICLYSKTHWLGTVIGPKKFRGYELKLKKRQWKIAHHNNNAVLQNPSQFINIKVCL